MTTSRIDRDRQRGAGARTWYFPDGDRPPVDGGPTEAHESLMVFNVSDRAAHLELDLYWEDREPTVGIKVQIRPESVRSLRVPWWEDPVDADRVDVPVRCQYAIRLRSDVPVICQYGRLEVTPNYELYTTMGYVDLAAEEEE